MKKLNFGCGEDIRKGFDNVDVQKNSKIFKSFDFNQFPYPLKEDSYDYVWSRSVLEHLNEPDQTLNELWRACKNKAIIEIIVPYYNNKSAVSDMQHRRFFSDTTFKVFVEETCKINKEKKFKIALLTLVPTKIGRWLPKFLREKLSLFFGGIISYVHVQLQVIKK